MRTLRATEVFRDSTLTLIAIETVTFLQNKTTAGGQVCGIVEPVAVIFSTQGETYALDMEARPTDLNLLEQDVPGLEGILRRSGT